MNDNERYKAIRINVTEDILNDLRGRAEARGITVTEWIKRAVVLMRFVEDNAPLGPVPDTGADSARRQVAFTDDDPAEPTPMRFRPIENEDGEW